jgi:hypothetical protein
MEKEPGFEKVRTEVEANQKAILWEDGLRNGRSVDAFLWKGDPKAKPIQRAGLALFGLTFLLLTITIASIPFQKKFEDGWSIDFLLALFALLISMRLLRNAFLRRENPPPVADKEEKD